MSDTSPRSIWHEVARADFIERFASQCTLRGSAEEVLLGFASTVEPDPASAGALSVPVHTRIVMTLPAAKRLALGLRHMLEQFEQRFGEIAIDQQAQPQALAGFPTLPLSS
jgi:hypothetical protein